MVVPSVYVVFRSDADVLLQLRQNTGYRDGHWACAAAGHIELGESVVDAARREATEELGIEVEASNLRPLCTMHRTQTPHGATDERVDFFFECRTWRGEPSIAEPAKTAALEWFPLSELPTPVVPHERRVFDDIARDRLATIIHEGFDPVLPR